MAISDVYSVPKMARRILRLYARATLKDRAEGAAWYGGAHEAALMMAERRGVSIEIAVGVLAAISPGLRWERNFHWADRLLEFAGVLPDGELVPTYSQVNVVKAVEIITGSDPDLVLGGPKVRAFYALILLGGDSDTVCVDTHAKDIALGIKDEGIRGGVARPGGALQVANIAEAYRVAARKVGIRPCDLQAITWVAWRRLKGVSE